jgi:diaminopimelate epimerase
MRDLAFYKMTGSGNDFVVVDTREGQPADDLRSKSVVEALCARGTGIGADGLVLLEQAPGIDFRMVYFNADGSRASMCGNAALCCTRLAIELGAKKSRDLVFDTDAGRMRGRIRDGVPEIDLTPVTEVREDAAIVTEPGESRIGFAIAGVPHLTTLCEDVADVVLERRGRALRFDPRVMPAGANANFVSKDGADTGWEMRTFERGVEGETLACGTGAVASAVLLTQWGLATGPVALRTRSGRTLTVRLTRIDGGWQPSLSGEGRIVFEGHSRELDV